MPFRDGTGPQGLGKMSGRGNGPCGNGKGMGRGLGTGFGRCRGCNSLFSTLSNEDLTSYKNNLEKELELVKTELEKK